MMIQIKKRKNESIGENIVNEKITVNQLGEILAEIANKMVTPVRVTKDTAPAYYQHLSEYPPDLVRAAANYYIEGPDAKFFPSISDLLQNIRELLRLSVGIPSPMEAWGMILDSNRYKQSQWCEIGAGLRKAIEGKINSEYWRALSAVHNHENACGVCHGSYDYDDFGHPAVTATVRRLGGKSYIITGNPTSDRIRFMDAYKEIVEREFRMITTSPSIRGYIESITVKPGGLLEGKINSLAARLGAPAKKLGHAMPERVSSLFEIDSDEQEINQEQAEAFDRGVGE
jgi:hypothetical protein